MSPLIFFRSIYLAITSTSFLLLLLSLPSIYPNAIPETPHIDTTSTYVAVCISGQTGRMMPRFLAKNLFESNPNFKFHLFYNLNPSGSDVVYNTLWGYNPSFFAVKSQKEIAYHLGKIYSYPNVLLKNLSFWEPMPEAYYQK